MADEILALRIEWSKAWARTRRWHEETRMVTEEARRLPVSLEHRAKEWERRVQQVPLGTIAFEEAQGAIAYGLKQAALYRDIAERAGVTMTEERRGKGRPRRRIVEDEDVFMDGGGVGGNGAVGEDSEDDEDEIGLDDDEDELEQWAGDVSDEEHLLGGGEDDD